MKIAVDGGSLCQKNYSGNKVFSQNLLKAISLYDNENNYIVYTYCQKKFNFGEKIKIFPVLPKFGWSKIGLSLAQLINPKDIFLALNQSIPLLPPKKIISFCHGLSYFFYPQFYPDSINQLKSQLKSMIKNSDYIIVSSIKVKNELLSIYKNIEKKIIVIPFGIPYDMQTKEKKIKKEKFFLYVGINHPIKNIQFIKKAFDKFKKETADKEWQLILVTKDCSRQKLRKLYQKASGLLCASYYESFNFPALEALALGCPVIAQETAIIPEMRKFVFIAKKEEEFVNHMITIAKNNSIIEAEKIKEIKKIFNWQNFLLRLKKLY